MYIMAYLKNLAELSNTGKPANVQKVDQLKVHYKFYIDIAHN